MFSGDSPFRFLQQAVKNVGDTFDNTIAKRLTSQHDQNPPHPGGAPSSQSALQPGSASGSGTASVPHRQAAAEPDPSSLSAKFSEFFEKKVVANISALQPGTKASMSPPKDAAAARPTANIPAPLTTVSESSTSSMSTPAKVRSNLRIQVKFFIYPESDSIRVRMRERLPAKAAATPPFTPLAGAIEATSSPSSVIPIQFEPPTTTQAPSSVVAPAAQGTPDVASGPNPEPASKPLEDEQLDPRPSVSVHSNDDKQPMSDMHAVSKTEVGHEAIAAAACHVSPDVPSANVIPVEVASGSPESDSTLLLKQQIADLQSALLQRERQLETTQMQFAESRQEVANLRAQVDSTVAPDQEIATRCMMLEQRIKQLRAEKRESDIRLIRLTEVEKQLKDATDALSRTKDNSHAVDQLNVRIAQMESENVELKNRLKRTTAKLEADLEAQVGLFAQMKSEYESSTQLLQRQNADLKDRVQKLVAERDSQLAFAQAQVVHAQSEDMMRQVESLQVSLQNQKNEFLSVRGDLQDRLNRMEEREKDLLLRVEDAEQHAQLHVERIRQLERAEKTAALRAFEAEKMSESLVAQIASLQNEAQSMQALMTLERSQWSEKATALRNEVQSLQKQLMTQHMSFQQRLEQQQQNQQLASVPHGTGSHHAPATSGHGPQHSPPTTALPVQSNSTEVDLDTLDEDLGEVESVAEIRTPTHESEQVHELRLKIDRLSLALARERQEASRTKKLQQRYELALQLIGEKEEQIQELQHDLRTVKETFRQQIEELCRQ